MVIADIAAQPWKNALCARMQILAQCVKVGPSSAVESVSCVQELRMEQMEQAARQLKIAQRVLKEAESHNAQNAPVETLLLMVNASHVHQQLMETTV